MGDLSNNTNTNSNSQPSGDSINDNNNNRDRDREREDKERDIAYMNQNYIDHNSNNANSNHDTHYTPLKHNSTGNLSTSYYGTVGHKSHLSLASSVSPNQPSQHSKTHSK